MTPEVFSVGQSATLAEIVELKETKRIKRIPDEDSDRLIRDQLLAELRRQEWASPVESNVVVSDGVVHFWGTGGSEEERRAIRVVAENIPGVRGIEDHTTAGPRYVTPLFPTA